MHQKITSPLARAENPKVQRPSEVSWSYLYLAPAMELRSNQTNAWTQVLAVDMDRVTTQHDGRASTRLSGIYVKNRLAGFHPYPVIICGISAGDTRLYRSTRPNHPRKKIRSLIHHEKRALGKGRKNQSTIATSTYKNTSPLARAENPKYNAPAR